jgi:hypothetical protein
MQSSDDEQQIADAMASATAEGDARRDELSASPGVGAPVADVLPSPGRTPAS